MEIIAIAGYITDEKMHIARDYLEKSTRDACGIKPEQVLSLSFIISRVDVFNTKYHWHLSFKNSLNLLNSNNMRPGNEK